MDEPPVEPLRAAATTPGTRGVTRTCRHTAIWVAAASIVLGLATLITTILIYGSLRGDQKLMNDAINAVNERVARLEGRVDQTSAPTPEQVAAFVEQECEPIRAQLSEVLDRTAAAEKASGQQIVLSGRDAIIFVDATLRSLHDRILRLEASSQR